MSYYYDWELDRKSSRGMIYENEELRLRTININAEVERGQSDIKRLRRENEQLRREIWTLRDECDRLNKRFKAKLIDHEHGGCSGRHEVCDGIHSHSNSEDSDSCDTCRGNGDDGQCSDEFCQEESCLQAKYAKSNSNGKQPIVEEPSEANNAQSSALAPISLPNCEEPIASLPGNSFDHLSVVSEETLSNNELLAPQNERLLGYAPEFNGPPHTLPSFVGPLTPLTPIELVANQLNDLQATVPPLSYFENIVQQQHMGSTIGNTPDMPAAYMVRHTNGWDYNLQSPFLQSKVQHKIPSSASAQQQQRMTPAPPTVLTTFVPTGAPAAAAIVNTDVGGRNVPNGNGATTSTTMCSAPQESAVSTIAAPGLNSSKHFFAPLKPRLKLNTALANKTLVAATVPTIPPVPAPAAATTAGTTQAAAVNANAEKSFEPPDIFVANALASPYQRQAIAAVTNVGVVPATPPLPQRTTSQTDSVNLKCILNEIETISEDILAIQLEKHKSRENLTNVPPPNATINASQQVLPQPEDKTKKPYRSEMNLTLSYDGSNDTVVPSTTAPDSCSTAQCMAERRRTRSLEREESPTPNMPDPMVPFPVNRTYISFDQPDGPALTKTKNAPLQKAPVPPPPVTPQKPPPPVPPARMYPPPLNIRCAGVTRGAAATSVNPSPPVQPGLAPNKSHLYTAVANAAAKRALFRAAPAHMTRSLDTDPAADVDADGTKALETPQDETAESTPTSEASRRKARRVSIVCSGDTAVGTPLTPDMITQQTSPLRPQTQPASASNTPLVFGPATGTNFATGSCVDLSTMANPALKHLKQGSQSTPNSPHSSRHRTNSNNMINDQAATTTPGVAPHPGNNSQVPHFGHSHSNAAQQRKNSQESIHANCSDLAVAAAIAARSKCSRRHSDGTVNKEAQRISGGSGHHHHHHHHPHPSSVLSNNPHHSHHSHQDSNHETGTSLSDRNSNSLASSRESSTSFSMRSQRRKISISSHTGGKIPWCGCWGNGCL